MHPCPDCRKSFPSLYKLQRHRVVHTGQRPFACAVCGKAFTQSVHLKTHWQNVHRGTSDAPHGSRPSPRHEEEEKNVGCFQESNTTEELKPSAPLTTADSHPGWNHVTDSSSLPLSETAHTAPVSEDPGSWRSFPSDMGPVSQGQRDSARVDTSESDGRNEYPCKTASTSHQLQNPSRVPNESDSTLKKLDTDGPLDSETVTVSDSIALKHECYHCLKTFCSPSKLQRHLQSHTSQKLHSCTVCSKSFTQKSHLKSHLGRVNKCSPENRPDRKTSPVQGPSCGPKPSAERNLLGKLSVNTCQEAASVTGRKRTCSAAGDRRTNTSHECPFCSKSFPSASKLERHMMVHTGLKPFTCEVCGKRFRQKTHLRVHSRSHLWSRYQKQRSMYISRPPSAGLDKTDPKKEVETHFVKDIFSAGQLDPTGATLGLHNTNRSKLGSRVKRMDLKKISRVCVKGKQMTKPMATLGKERHKCFMCLKSFPSASKLQRHEMVHTGVKPFQCPKCGKTFRQLPHLKTHESRCGNRKPVKPLVPHMEKTSSQQNDGDQNVGVRTSPLQPSTNTTFSDGVVRKSRNIRAGFLTKPTCVLTTNTKSNTCPKRKLHTCRICAKSFPTPFKLSRHLLTHSGMRPFKCALCRRSFTQHCHLKLHERRCTRTSPIWQQTGNETQNSEMITNNGVTPNGTSRLNEVAAKAIFPSASESLRHQTGHASPNPLRQLPHVTNHETACTPPIQRMSTETNAQRLRPEVRVDPNSTASLLVSTTAAKSNTFPNRKLHVCRICSKSFPTPYKLSRHFLTHSGMRPFGCNACGKTYTQLGHLKLHERRCGQGSRPPRRTLLETPSTTEDEDVKNITEGSDFNTSLHRTSIGDFVNSTEEMDGNWASVQEVGLKEEETEDKTTVQVSACCSYSFHFQPTCETNNPVDRQKTALSHDVAEPRRDEAAPDKNGLLSPADESRSMADFSDDDLCEPVIVFECGKCFVSFTSENDLKLHFCSSPVLSEFAPPVQRSEGTPTDGYEPVSAHCSYSFPFQLARETNKLIESHNLAVSHQYEVEEPRKDQSSERTRLLSSVDESRTLACFSGEVLSVFECAKCFANFTSEGDLRRHVCPSEFVASPKRNQCDVCLKVFVSPSKLKRHQLVHTGQRPFPCDVCGRTFTQESHVRKHRLIHQ